MIALGETPIDNPVNQGGGNFFFTVDGGANQLIGVETANFTGTTNGPLSLEEALFDFDLSSLVQQTIAVVDDDDSIN